MKINLPAAAATIAFAILTACSSGDSIHYRKCTGSVWATTYHITYRSAVNLDDSIYSVMNRVDDSLSPFSPTSVISRINSGADMATDSLVRRIFLASQRFNALSHGAFDPTVAPLVNLWGFGYRNIHTEPTAAQIDSALRYVGISQCSLQGNLVVKASDHTEFNFSAITKGYACDLIGEMMSRNGCDDYMVEIGGEMSLRGRNAHGDKWRVMIDAPIESDSAVVHSRMAVIEVTDAGIATSGNYRNYRHTAEGKVWHTINPATGYPAHTTTLSATVVAPDAMSADALATACMSMESDSAIAMIESLPATSVMLVRADSTGYRLLTSRGFPSIN